MSFDFDELAGKTDVGFGLDLGLGAGLGSGALVKSESSMGGRLCSS
jgi:hypothetical protein